MEDDLSNRRGTWSTIALLLLVGLLAGSAAGQQRYLRCRITYCTTAHIYMDAGTAEGFAIGDTLSITRGDTSVGGVVITGIATHSAVARPIDVRRTPRIGDHGMIAKDVTAPPPPTAAVDTSMIIASPSLELPATGLQEHRTTVLSGRIAVQFTGLSAEDSRLTIAQPSLVAQVRLEDLAGTGMVVSLRGSGSYDKAGPYLRYGDSAHTRTDLREFSIALDQPGSVLGFSAGRFISRYVSGVGAIDGGEAFLRIGPFTAGGLAGGGVQSRVLGYGKAQRFAGGFLGYHAGTSLVDAYDASVAYVRQTVGGELDRAFLSIQNAIAMGSHLSAYGTVDVELKTMTNGVISSQPTLSSLLFFVNYVPMSWLSTNVGYDGTRSVYLFESMKGVSDSLFHEAMRQGFRVNGTARLGMGYTLTAELGINSRGGGGGSSHTIGAGLRVTDIFSTRVFGSARFRTVSGAFLDGTQWSFAVGRNIGRQIDALLQYETRSYSVGGSVQRYTTQTFSGSANMWLSRTLYSMVSADYILDPTMNGFRYFLELGYRF